MREFEYLHRTRRAASGHLIEWAVSDELGNRLTEWTTLEKASDEMKALKAKEAADE